MTTKLEEAIDHLEKTNTYLSNKDDAAINTLIEAARAYQKMIQPPKAGE